PGSLPVGNKRATSPARQLLPFWHKRTSYGQVQKRTSVCKNAVRSADYSGLMHFNDLLQQIVERGASDVHIHVGLPAMARVSGKLTPVTEGRITPKFTSALVDLMCNP